jgi:predicted ATP-dependent endonuclease of OLD family
MCWKENMAYSKFQISGYKGFATSQTIEFAIPNGQPGSGLTILVGPNNSGKSSLLEALGSFSRDEVSFSVDKRNVHTGRTVELRLTEQVQNNENHIVIKTINTGGSSTEKIGIFKQGTILALPSRRFFNSTFSKNTFARMDYVKNIGGAQQVRTQATEVFAYRLFQINKPEVRPNFDKVLSKVLSPLPNWTIDQNQSGQYFLQFTSNGTDFSSEGVGEGILNLFYIVDALYDSSEDTMIAIDEPEVSLHPSLQKRLMNLLIEYSAKRQIVISTHSSYFLPLELIGDGLSITRVNNSTDGTKFYTLSPDIKNTLSKLVNNIHVPHTLGLNAKELFFLEENIILVEGQEDVLIYPMIASQVNKFFNGNFFGWGVGGAAMMGNIAQLTKELGFLKVVGILDGDMKDVRDELEKKFPEYFFCILPAIDIRDKEAITAKPAKEGIATTKGKLKSEYVEQLMKLIDEINAKFN